MEQFLIYIIISSLVTLISVVFAYKPEEEDLRLAEFNNKPSEGRKIESAPVYSEQPLKTNNQNSKISKLEATLS